MFSATKPFKDTITNYSNEPSLRIGTNVPKNAVNLAYYYNPTATDAEKILSAEAPRVTIDHRVEEAYRYLFNQSSEDDDLFPNSVYYEDEEGYTGRLGRMFVNWYPQVHIETKNVTQDRIVYVQDKNALPKIWAYSDEYGYEGNLFLDATSWEVNKYKDQIIETNLDRKITEHEIIYSDVFPASPYVSPQYMDQWMKDPINYSDSPWPKEVYIWNSGQEAKSGNVDVVKYVNHLTNPYDYAEGSLKFQSLKYELVAVGQPKRGELTNYREVGVDFVSETYSLQDLLSGNIYVNGHKLSGNTGLSPKRAEDMADMAEAANYGTTVKNQMEKLRALLENETDGKFKPLYQSHYDSLTDKYDYQVVNEFFSSKGPWNRRVELNGGMTFYEGVHDTIKAQDRGTGQGGDIMIVVDNETTMLINNGDELSDFYFLYKYKYMYSNRGEAPESKYNIVANYGGTLTKVIKEVKQIPSEYKVTCSYTGIARKIWYDYDGMAYYRGAITKGNSVGSVNPEGDNELLMYCDEDGYLRRPVTEYTEEGIPYTKNYYTVEADYVYITDIFKDGVACFYKYPISKPIYDYRGPDSNGFYSGNAIKINTSNFKELPEGYKYNLKLEPSDTEWVDVITEDFNIVQKEIPTEYKANLYTSFISSATDTFKATYNSYNHNNLDVESGVTEDIFNYPFMVRNIDYTMEPVDRKSRTNRIKMTNNNRIFDNRASIQICYVVKAKRKQQLNEDGSIAVPEQEYTSHYLFAQVLNKDYALQCEYDQFEGRGYIISPKSEELYMTPMDIVLQHQSEDGIDPIVHSKDKDLIFTAEIVEMGSPYIGNVNLKCNPDGSGFITAETSEDTGFYDEKTGLTNIKLDISAPYYIDGSYIYPAFKVKCVDSRFIKVKAPREEKLLESWYPLIQFGHYSQVIDQHGTSVKVAYSLPEYDTQEFSTTWGAPYVDISLEQVKIINSHTVKTLCYPLFVTDNVDATIKLYKKIDDELFDIDIENVSFSDGIIITKDTISENDLILCTYTYVEENFVYRGFWRDKIDFVRLDVNPNIYHTYNDPTYIPSEIKPSKNLFNKVLYFFLKPTAVYDGSVTVMEEEKVLTGYDEFGEPVYEIQEVEKVVRDTGADTTKDRTIKIPIRRYRVIEEPIYEEVSVQKYVDSDTSIQNIEITKNEYQEYKELMRFTPSENYTGKIKLKVNQGHLRGFVILKYYENTVNPADSSFVIYNNKTISNALTDADVSDPYNWKVVYYTGTEWNENLGTTNMTSTGYFANHVNEDNLPEGVEYFYIETKQDVTLEANSTYIILTIECAGGKNQPWNYTFDSNIDFNVKIKELKTVTESVDTGRVNKTYEEYIDYTEVPITYDNVLQEHESCLYHKIDDSEPDSELDIYIGSIYIRQNTSLHSTILLDSRTRGGGVLESIPDDIRSELEPESDYYLDIGYYDGKPYQENGIIIVRLDQRILKDFGGRFTKSDVESKVKRWLGSGVYPIIEYVNSYAKQDLPQYTLEVENTYTNVENITPVLNLECTEI